MREWARTDDEVAESVRAADRRVWAAVRTAFLDSGFAPPTRPSCGPTRRLPWGIGLLHLSGPVPPHPRQAARSERFLDLMLAT